MGTEEDRRTFKECSAEKVSRHLQMCASSPSLKETVRLTYLPFSSANSSKNDNELLLAQISVAFHFADMFFGLLERTTPNQKKLV